MSEDRKKVILEQYDQVIGNLKKGKVDKGVLQRTYKLKEQVEKAGPVELYTEQFRQPMFKELESIAHEIQSSELRRRQRKEFLWRLYFFLLVPCYFWFYTFTSLQKKILVNGQVALIVWIIMGFLTTTLTLPLFIYYSFVATKLTSLVPTIFTKVVDTQKLFLIRLTIFVVEGILFAVAFASIFTFFISVYPQITSPLATLVKQAFMLNIPSIIGILSLIIGDLAALIAIYEFFEKKLHKRY